MAVLNRSRAPAAQTPDLSDWFEGVYYPSSDGKPMGETSWQVTWITLVYGELSGLLPDHFVAADMFWYPVRGQPRVCTAPDVMVVLGRPGHPRASYWQWQEDDVAPAVIFEFVSRSDTARKLAGKQAFYERHGVREYYVYDPRPPGRSRTPFLLRAWQRHRGDRLEEVDLPAAGGWRSPLLDVTFTRKDAVPGGELCLIRPDGEPFRTVADLRAEAERERVRAEQERVRAEQERIRADGERRDKEALEAKLRALGIDPAAP